MNETYRTERTHLVDLLCDLKDQQIKNPAPELENAIRKIRRRVLGLYTAVMNKRKFRCETVYNAIAIPEIVVS